MASSSSSINRVYDVFPSFSGEDVRVNFLSHFLKELDRKLIIAFKDNEIQRSRSLDPELKQAIRDSSIAVVVFSKNYGSSSWCLNELLEIVKCKEEFGQKVIPVFYGLDPSHVRKQTGDFGKIFQETCKNKAEDVINQWQNALTDVANTLGYHSVTWGNDATLIEAIANDVLGKVLVSPPSKDYENFVGIENHIARMSALLHLKSKEVRMVGIWGSSGIGKTTIARALFNRLSRHFQGSIYIDRRFLSKSMEIYCKSNPDDYNMKLHLQENFLSKILDKPGIEVDHLGAVEGKLKDMKVLIFIDDLDDQVVLDTLVGGYEWFGPRSRVIVITKDKQILRGHGINYIYEVGIPSKKVALQMFCRSAFRQNSPPDGFMELACEVVVRAGSLPLGLNLLGSSLRKRKKEYWVDMLPTLRKGLDGKIEKALRVSYDGLERKEHKALFRYIACFFNGNEIDNIKLMLADSELNVDIGLETLVDRSLVQIVPSWNTNIVEMHCLVEEMGKEIVRAQSDDPRGREFLMDSKSIRDVLEDSTGTKHVLGISLDINEIDEIRMHKEAFKEMRNLRFLNIYSAKWGQKKEIRWHLPEGFDYLPPKLKLLSWEKYPFRCMPSKFHPENIVKIQMPWSKLEKLWDGVHPLAGLKEINLLASENLKEIPDLSMATNLEELILMGCSSLVELPFSIKHLNKLETLRMDDCKSLESLPTGINLESLSLLNLSGCSQLRSFPDISSNISMLELWNTCIDDFPSHLRLENLDNFKMYDTRSEKLGKRVQPLIPLMNMLSPSLSMLQLSNITSLVELPSSFQNLHKLEGLFITDCINLKTLPSGINLKSLKRLDLSRCSRLRSFPDISTNISELNLSETAIEEFPSKLRLENLVILNMCEMRSDKLWDRVQPLTPLMAMLSPSLKTLQLSHIPTLVELPSSIHNFHQLENLSIMYCINLERLPTGINLEYLRVLNLCGCSRLWTFPDISTNISLLILTETGIEEVPWWIEDFSKLTQLHMRSCSKLEYIDLNISKMIRLWWADFSNCEALTRADLLSEVAMEADNIDTETELPAHEDVSCSECSIPLRAAHIRFINCFNLDQEALLHSKSIIFNSMIFTGEEVPSYFTHRTSGTSVTNIPLLHISPCQPFFTFRACALVGSESIGTSSDIYYVNVYFRFTDRLGNHIDAQYYIKVLRMCEVGSHMFIFDCCFPLDEENDPAEHDYDHVDIQFQLDPYYNPLKLIGCGVQLFEDDESSDEKETDCNEEWEECEDRDLGSETDHSEEWEDCDDTDLENNDVEKK